jgi:3-hydroxybutyryl-CoA dehydrogenase
MGFSKVGVVGGGLMGSGIAEVSARHGLKTTVVEVDQGRLDGAKKKIEQSLARGKEAGKLTEEEFSSANQLLDYQLSLGSLADCDIVIEAVMERLDEKKKVFETLDSVTSPTAILATNTSSIPIIEIASATKRPHKVVGTHFFNPVPVMKLIELVRSVATSDETFQQAKDFSAQLDKQVIVAQDRGGFIVNYLLMPYLSNAMRMYESQFASRDDIDAGMKLGCSHPMGPLELADFVGLDTALFVCEAMYQEYGTPEFVPPPLLRRMVAGGLLGRKSGQGFYHWENGKRVD